MAAFWARRAISQPGTGRRNQRCGWNMETHHLHVQDATLVAPTSPLLRTSLPGLMRRTLQSPATNVMENLSGGVVDLESLLLELADDADDRRSCLHDERQSGASRRKAA